MNNMKLMVYSHDAFGLGNLRRMLAICNYLLKCWPRLSILLVSGSPMLQGFRLPKGLDYIKLPCLSRGEAGELSAKYLGTTIEETVKLRTQLIYSAAIHFKPDLLLVDKKPTGLRRELSPTLTYLKEQLPKSKCVLLLRDILDTPEKTTAEWHRLGYYQALKTYYEQVLVVGMKSIFDLVQAYEIPLPFAKRVHYCGYIRKHLESSDRDELRQQFGLTACDRLILVTPGGGEDGYALVKTYLQGLKYLAPQRSSPQRSSPQRSSPDRSSLDKSSQKEPLNSTWTIRNSNIHSLILCGPEMPTWQQMQLRQMAAAYDRVTLKVFTDDLLGHLAAADAVVCMGGYNTLTETLSLGKRAVVVPRIRPSQEQLIRSTEFAKQGLVRMIHPERVTPRSLIQGAIAQAFLPEPHSNTAISESLDFKGLPRVAHHLAELLEPTLQPAPVLSLFA